MPRVRNRHEARAADLLREPQPFRRWKNAVPLAPDDESRSGNAAPRVAILLGARPDRGESGAPRAGNRHRIPPIGDRLRGHPLRPGEHPVSEHPGHRRACEELHFDLARERRAHEAELERDPQAGGRGVGENQSRDALRLRRGGEERDRAPERVADENDAIDTAGVEILPEVQDLRADRVVVGPGPVRVSESRKVHGDRRVPRGGRLQDPLPGSGGREKAVDVNDRLRLRSPDFPGSPANALHDGVSLPSGRRRNPPVRLGQASDHDGERDDEDQGADKADQAAQALSGFISARL
jgi:hypothetical protein